MRWYKLRFNSARCFISWQTVTPSGQVIIGGLAILALVSRHRPAAANRHNIGRTTSRANDKRKCRHQPERQTSRQLLDFQNLVGTNGCSLKLDVAGALTVTSCTGCWWRLDYRGHNTITSGTSGRVGYNNAGVYGGEYPVTGGRQCGAQHQPDDYDARDFTIGHDHP